MPATWKSVCGKKGRKTDLDILSYNPDVIVAKEKRRWQKGVFLFLALAVALTTVILLINPATTEEYKPICGLDEHEHGPECFGTADRAVCDWEETPAHVHGDECFETVLVCVCGLEDDPDHEHTEECFAEEKNLICGLPENEIHEHTEACVEWQEELVCGIDDPEHEHTEACFGSVPVLICERRDGVGHVHNELCFVQEEILTCGMQVHVHTDECYPKLTGNPNADVFTRLDWESTFCDVKLTGVWAEDLVAIAESQLGRGESEENFVTDEFNVRHGYTYYGDWYGVRYAGWNAICVMFCMHYADIWGVPTDSVPANWMNMAKARDELWIEADGEPGRGDLVFFDDDADGFADRVAIVTQVREDTITVILGGTQTKVHKEDFTRDFPNIAGYMAMPENPNPPEPDEGLMTLDVKEEEPQEDVILTALTADGMAVTLTAPAESLPYPADELSLTAEAADPFDYGEELAIIEGDLAAAGKNIVSSLLYDITVWRAEPVAGPEPEPAAEETETEADEAEEAAEEEFKEPENVREPETILVTVEPEGPFEITVEGLGDDTTVWRFGGTGPEELEAAPGDSGMTFFVRPN